MNGYDQFPDSQQYHAHQEDTAHHCQQNHEDICPSATLWLFESCEDGLPAGVLGIRELHHTVVISLVVAKHSAGVIRFESLHGDDFILAQALAGLVVCEPSRIEEAALNTLPLSTAGIRAGRAFLTGVSE